MNGQEQRQHLAIRSGSHWLELIEEPHRGRTGFYQRAGGLPRWLEGADRLQRAAALAEIFGFRWPTFKALRASWQFLNLSGQRCPAGDR